MSEAIEHIIRQRVGALLWRRAEEDRLEKAKLGYFCDQCHGTFIQDWSDEEAAAEFAENFPDCPHGIEASAKVCDDCYAEIMRWKDAGCP